MLVITRKVRESFVVGEDVTVTVLAVEGLKVRIGVEAPKETRVLRSELLARFRPGKGNAHEDKS